MEAQSMPRFPGRGAGSSPGAPWRNGKTRYSHNRQSPRARSRFSTWR